MPRLTLRTLLAYIDDTLEPAEARDLGKKVADSEEAQALVDRIKKVTRRRGLAAPTTDDEEATSDPNTVAAYLDNALESDLLREVEETCLNSDLHLAEVAACHQILTLVLTEPVRVPPRAHKRMYELVQPPASVPNRKPSKTLPVSGATPPADGPADADDADAALLLGMKRYSATTSWAARLVLFAAAAVLLMLLGAAVFKSWPKSDSEPFETARATAPADGKAHRAPDATGSTAKGPSTSVPPGDKKGEPAVPPMVMPEPRPLDANAVVPGPVGPEPLPPPMVPFPGEKIDAPVDRQAPIGRLVTDRVLVVTYRGAWLRQPVKLATDNPDLESVVSMDPVMALPGHKADILLGPPNKPDVEIHLWGNIPEQLPYRVLESKVVFHQPAPGFDADLTLHAGRIYLKNKKAVTEKKPVPVKVRVRLANTKEVWDVVLADETTDVLVELISWFKPGTPFAKTGGDEPKREARAAVLKGRAAFHDPTRFEKFDPLDANAQITWDSVTNVRSKPAPIPVPQEAVRVPVLDGGFQKVLTRVLTEMADAVTAPDRVRTVMKIRLDPPPEVAPRDRELVARLAIYSWAALAESTEDGAKSLQELVDILNSELAWLSRQAVVTAFVQWVARDKGNTALLDALLSKPGTGVTPLVTADAVMEMLRCYVSPLQPDPDRLDKLVERLAGAKVNEFDKPDKALALRDVALWNLVAADLGVWIPPPIGVNVGAVGAKFDTAEYQKFIADWKTRVEKIKKRPPLAPPPKMP
jgi:hypothetical protein